MQIDLIKESSRNLHIRFFHSKYIPGASCYVRGYAGHLGDEGPGSDRMREKWSTWNGWALLCVESGAYRKSNEIGV